MVKLRNFFDKTSVIMVRIATVFMCLVCLAIILNIVGRAFNSPIQGTMEIIQYGMLVAVAFGLCRTGFLDRHIFVPVLLNVFQKKVAACIRCFTLVVTACIFGYLVYHFLNELPDVSASGHVTDIYKISFVVVYLILDFGMLVAAIMFLYQAVYALLPFFAKEEDS